MNKKGAGVVVAIIVVIALFILFSKVIDLATRECSADKDCTSDSYCGSDFQCHKYPVITHTNYIPAALILGVCIVVAAAILRWKK
ncbi:MAG: hypothetical protein WC254_04900 [Candidatus Woesearchaeota archaeon]|jgi:hypothetical protein